MALFVLKPIVWNRENYRRPSGVLVNSGYPNKYGFGHEEWNNSPALRFVEGEIPFRAFHTEGVGRLAVEAEAGHVFIFMYASHDGIQELVGIAGNATCLMGAGDKPKRIKLAERLALDRLGDDAWRLRRVQALLGGNRKRFDVLWNQDVDWIPNWICPEASFLWFDTPVPLDPQDLRGTTKLLTMFSRYTALDRAEALKVVQAVPNAARDEKWRHILREIGGVGSSMLAEDLREIEKSRDISSTTRHQLILARVGQGGFRGDLEAAWNGACAVTGCRLPAVLRASHIKAWALSTNAERLDEANGLLLTANLDALFDRGLISFADDGAMLLSSHLPAEDRDAFGLPRPLLQQPTKQQRGYLADHRSRWGY